MHVFNSDDLSLNPGDIENHFSDLSVVGNHEIRKETGGGAIK